MCRLTVVIYEVVLKLVYGQGGGGGQRSVTSSHKGGKCSPSADGLMLSGDLTGVCFICLCFLFLEKDSCRFNKHIGFNPFSDATG